eukprot:6195068-Pleurochrysis_carterae.AAC.6
MVAARFWTSSGDRLIGWLVFRADYCHSQPAHLDGGPGWPEVVSEIYLCSLCAVAARTEILTTYALRL